jgi:hypothetical protein
MRVRLMLSLALALLAAPLPAFAQVATPVSVYAPGLRHLDAATTPAPCRTDAPVVPIVDEPCGPPGCLWFDTDYLFWHLKGDPTPPLVTTSPAGTDRSVAGVLNQPGTRTLVGGEHEDDQWTVGTRIRAGAWLDQNHADGIELGFFYLWPIRQSYFVGGDNPIIARPFFNTSTGVPDSHLVNFPGVVTGDITIHTKAQMLGAEANMVFNLICCEEEPALHRLDFLFGYRYINLQDRILIQERQRFLVDDTFAAGTTILTTDRFHTNNDIHAANLALNYRCQMDNLWVGLRTGVALGMLKATSNIDGQTITTLPGSDPTTTNTGFLAQGTNIGRQTGERFAAIFEGSLMTGYQVTDHLSLTAGYTLLYINRVERAGDQMNLSINPSQLNGGSLIGSPAPIFTRERTDFFLHGANIGAELRF